MAILSAGSHRYWAGGEPKSFSIGFCLVPFRSGFAGASCRGITLTVSTPSPYVPKPDGWMYARGPRPAAKGTAGRDETIRQGAREAEKTPDSPEGGPCPGSQMVPWVLCVAIVPRVPIPVSLRSRSGRRGSSQGTRETILGVRPRYQLDFGSLAPCRANHHEHGAGPGFPAGHLPGHPRY